MYQIMDADMCRVCLENDTHLNMIYPCKCAGTNKYIHKMCFEKSLTVDPVKCRSCLYEYKFRTQSVNCLLRFIATSPILSLLLYMSAIVGVYFVIASISPNKLDHVVTLWNIDTSIRSQYFIASEIIVLGSFHIILIFTRLWAQPLTKTLLYTSINLIAFVFFNIINIICIRTVDNEVFASTTIFTLIMLIPISYGYKQCYDDLSKRVIDNYEEPV